MAISADWTYFLRDPNCVADNPFQSNCTCWVRAGTGPHADLDPAEDQTQTWRSDITRGVIWPATLER